MGFRNNPTSGGGRGVIERTFAPEFRNRLDAWIAFQSLAFSTIEQVVDKFIAELRAQLETKKVTIALEESGRAWLAKHGYDPAFGARPMSRLIHSKIKEPLVDAILFGKLEGGGHVVVSAEGDELKLLIRHTRHRFVASGRESRRRHFPHHEQNHGHGERRGAFAGGRRRHAAALGPSRHSG